MIVTILGTLRHGSEGSQVEVRCANWKSPHDLASWFALIQKPLAWITNDLSITSGPSS
jgi:hypothetical protein